jgi:gliding motility-associated-like protein
MKNTLRLIPALILLLVFGYKSNAQADYSRVMMNHILNYVYDPDSLSGFNEEAVTNAAVSEGIVGSELKVKLFREKRNFINAKYGVKRRVQGYNPAAHVVSPACTNEDFEGSAAATIVTMNQVSGWTCTGDNNLNYPDNCNLQTCCPNNPSESAIVNCPAATGFVDPVIGGTYPLYSVFGNGNNNGNGGNPQVPFQMGGTKIIRINNTVNDNSVEKLSKTFAVTPNNAVFEFAFVSIFSVGHGCCDGSNFTIKVSVNNTVLACPQFSVATPGAGCASTTPVSYYVAGTGVPFTGNNGSYVFNKWVVNSLDLSGYIGQNVTINIITSDCLYGGHYSCVYFDAQCLPMTIIGNGNGFPAGTPSITLPTCGAAGATVVAPAGLGPYSWNSGQISIPANLTVPNYTNTTLITNQSGTVMLTMNPPGSCAPINKVITVTITPAPQVVASATQAGCTNTLSAASITCAGSASVNPTITWSPTPGSLSGNSLTATGLPVGITTITVYDQVGCQVTATLNILPTPPPVTFTVNNLTGSYSVTCLNPTINLQAVSNYTYGTISYSWTSPSFTANTSTVSITQANTLVVTAVDPATGCQAQNTVVVGINTVAPTTTVNPTSQVITCNSGSPVTFTSSIFSPTVNIQHDWYSPLNPLPGGVPIASSNNSISVLSGNVPPGIYTVVCTNLVNGCKTVRQVTVTSLSAFPTFSVASPTGFSVGCAPLNQTTINIINPISTQTPPATCSYTFLPPTFTGAVTPSVILGGNTSTVTTIPGTWTVIVEDNSNWCRTELTIPIIQNTVAPNVSAAMLSGTVSTQTLTCYNPTILATGSSTTANTNITWLMPVAPPSLGSPTLVIGAPPTGPNTSTTSTSYANFTVVATNSVNACQSTSVVVINQNFKPPVSTPTISIGTATAIYCTAGTNPVVLTTGSSTVTSGVPFAFASPYLWEGPSPQATVTGASSYSCYVPGIYTLTIQDSYNGCLRTGTIQVLDRTQPPVITNPVDQATLDCGTNQAVMNIAIQPGVTGGVRYLVTEYPAGAAFTPSSAPVYNLNPLLSGTSSQSIQVSKSGSYEYVVSNTLTGCQAYGTVNVVPGDITADFNPSPSTGFAPLAVSFENTSHTSLGSGSITTIWSYGNGSSETFTYTNNGSATYTAAGTYTVMLLSQKGSCIDTAYKVIKVDLPSRLEVPNVFTPNGDGANDVFFLKVANITEVYAVILDRWGNKVYEVTSGTGNIAWDGKNLQGKECPAGTYFYVIKGTGKDDKDYQMKGNVSLFR